MRTFRSIRLSILVRAAYFALAVTSFALFARAESPPYQAHIVTPGAAVRSGPGETFYITDSLAEGQPVEVYREEPNGWLAIRPPQESFSWIYGKNLQLLDGGLAEVNKDNVASRIGSRLSSKRNAVQIRLKKGEIVQVIGDESLEGQTWYKVAPPSGEFRWINISSIRESPSSPANCSVANAVLTRPVASQAGEEEGAIQPAVESETTAVGGKWRAASVPLTDIAAPPLATAEVTPPTTSTSPSIPSIPTTPIAPADASASAPKSTNLQPNSAPPEGFARQVADLDLRLSRMIAESPATWNIDALQREAEQLLSQAQTVPDRDAVRAALTKIDRFAAIIQRYRQSGTQVMPPIVSPAAPRATAVRVSPPTDASGYDAVGVLRPVVSKRPGAPQFALVDEQGQVVSFVTATPDMNLQPYIGHRIGIAGSRGFIPEFRRAHVVANRVTPLAERVVR